MSLARSLTFLSLQILMQLLQCFHFVMPSDRAIYSLLYFFHHVATLALGSRPKQGGCKVAGQEGDLGVTSHAPESAKCVRAWTLTFPKELPCWELKSQKDSRIFRARLQGSKFLASKSFLYHWKATEVWVSKMGSHRPFWTSKTQVMAKRKVKSQFDNLTLDC
jgi:hypothetical protein